MAIPLHRRNRGPGAATAAHRKPPSERYTEKLTLLLTSEQMDWACDLRDQGGHPTVSEALRSLIVRWKTERAPAPKKAAAR